MKPGTFMVLALWLLPVAGMAAAPAKYPPVSVPVTLQRVSEHVYYAGGRAGAATEYEGFISNAGVIITREGIVVFDALGTPSLAWQLMQEIRRISDAPIKAVVVSHYHADHIYGLQVFKDEAGAEIIAPWGAQEYLGSEAAVNRLEERRFSLEPWVNERTRIVPPDRLVRKPEVMRLGGVELVITPVGKAHSDGDLTLYVRPDQVLFSGDIIFEGRVPWIGNANTRNWLRILEEMETSRLRALIPGHGPVAKNPNKAVALTRRYLQFLREHMGRAAREFIPFDEAYPATDWSAFKDLPAFDVANRRNAYQVFLAMEAEMLQE